MLPGKCNVVAIGIRTRPLDNKWGTGGHRIVNAGIDRRLGIASGADYPAGAPIALYVVGRLFKTVGMKHWIGSVAGQMRLGNIVGGTNTGVTHNGGARTRLKGRTS